MHFFINLSLIFLNINDSIKVSYGLVREYKRKTPKFTAKQLQNALIAVKVGISVLRAAKGFKISQSISTRYVYRCCYR